MRAREICLLNVLLCAVVYLGCGGGSNAFRDGRKAEDRKDYDSALVDYEKALQTDPENSQYLIHERLMRTQSSMAHLARGRTLLAGKREDEASGEFQKAVSIDPSNQAAAQELEKVLAQEATAKKERNQNLKKALEEREENTFSTAVQLKELPKEPYAHFHVTGDARKVFESIGQLAGLNVTFTSDFQSRPISVDLVNVTLKQILDIVSIQTRTFWKAVTPNTILVVEDSPGNRHLYEVHVLKTVYLSNPMQTADWNAITMALKQILQIQQVTDNPGANAVIIYDTPEKVAEAESLIRDIDQGKAEILIDVMVVEADRDRIRDLGLTPATISGSGSVAPGIQAAAAFNPAAATTAGTATAVPVGLGNLSYRDYSVVLPSAAANAVLNDSRTHILQNPQVRVTDGQTTKLNIGSRIPYATGSFLPSLGGAGTGAGGAGTGSFGLLASTAFQFQDVGVNLELTPHLLRDGEVSIKASIDISSLGPPANLGGVQQPTFNQRKIDQVIQLKEGEMNLLGGLIESTMTHAVTGVPFLSQVPLLRYFFSTEHNERVETEVLIMLTPRVVRLPEPSLAVSNARPVSGSSQPLVPATSQPFVPEQKQ